MSSQTATDGDRRARRVLAWVFGALAVLLVLLILARLILPPEKPGVAGPVVSPSPSASGTPSPDSGPTPTETPAPSPSPSLPSTGGGVTTTTGSGSTDAGASTGHPFTMTATLVGGALRPGAVRTLRVVVSNPNASAIELQRIDVGVGTPTLAGCLASWVQAGSFRAGIDPTTVVAGHGTATIALSIELVDLATVNQDACKGSTFPLSLSGTAKQVAT